MILRSRRMISMAFQFDEERDRSIKRKRKNRIRNKLSKEKYSKCEQQKRKEKR